MTLRQVTTWRWVQIVSGVLTVAAVFYTASAAVDARMGFWEFAYYEACLLMEMCALRHPLGHGALFDWRLPAVQAAALSGVQWLGMAATGVVVAVWAKRR